MRHSKNTRKQAISGENLRLAKILARPAPDYPQDRQPGQIIQRQNGQELIVELIPWGRCDQHRAVFPDGSEIRAGMDEIHAEIRRRLPPRKSVD